MTTLLVTVTVNTEAEADTIRAVAASFLGQPWQRGTTWSSEMTKWETADEGLYLLQPKYRPAPRPPWRLPDPPAGRQWHRTDWTEDMLPEGWRPLLDGNDDGSYEFTRDCGKRWLTGAMESIAATVYSSHCRTRRPLPATPRMVPLGPEDVPPGSVIKGIGESWISGEHKDCYMAIIEVTPYGIWCNRHSTVFAWKTLAHDWLIHRPGDNDADGKPAWRRCEKEAQP